ncbi:MAG: DUF4430 domain-containing protein [Lachnospiraceae bacterium]|nr:DUF4430 domain-containing protein [Lachnospiraceae bacterium]
MRMNDKSKAWKKLLCIVLIVVTALSCAGCQRNEKESVSSEEASVSGESTAAPPQKTVLGEGNVIFDLIVADSEGEETSFEIRTDKETVGEALQELELIDGDESEYGLFVKSVNGITADYDEDGVYWAFYVNGEYAQSGVDQTPITEGAQYALRIEKGA